MVLSPVSECEGGQRGDLSPGDLLTGMVGCWLASSTDQAGAGGVVLPVLLQVLDRAGVTAGRVVQLHLLPGAVWVSS